MKVSLNSVEKVKRFVTEVQAIDASVDLVSGRYVIDAKSIMGIFSLDLSKPIDIVLHSNEKEHLDKFNVLVNNFLAK